MLSVSGLDLARFPSVIAWELTRACAYHCAHCRADSQPYRDPDELDTSEALALVDDLAGFETRPNLVLTGGDPLFTLSQVALNDSIMIFAFAPIVALLLGLSSITVPWDTLLTSVVLYIVIPVLIAQAWRKALLARGQAAFDTTLARIGPWSITALLATLVLLFAFQGQAILNQPLVIALLAVPILIQVFFNAGLAYWLNRAVGEKHSVACPSALIGASNFFELAVAAAISLFGFESGAALATVVGVLIEVPVMLLVVKVVDRKSVV